MEHGAHSHVFRIFCAFAALLIVILPLMPLQAVAAAPAPQTTPLDMVIAVDESGSLTTEDVTREIQATSTIAQSVLNPQSRVTVLGFGSNNGQPGQQAVTEVCRPTLADGGVNLQYLSSCVKGLHRRSDAEGNDTDHVAALTQALSVLHVGSPQNALRVVFLLTDGALDVRHSPNYGSGDSNSPDVETARNAEAGRQLKTQLDQAVSAGVQIWPLGFGAQVTQGALDKFVVGDSKKACDTRTESRPRARIVRDSIDVTRSLSEAYAAATCSGLSQTDTGTLKSGETRDLRIDIPVIATDGTIAVTKGDPRVTVDYLDPKNRKVSASGTLDASTFTRSGENTATEALRIVNPLNGTWTIRLHAPSDLRRQLVSATALWQGAVQSSIVPEPPAARTGQQMTVRLSLLTRRGAITNAEAFRGLDFAVTATGAGLSAPQRITVRDDGNAPDTVAHDGSYAGTLAAPATAGDLVLTGEVSGPGIRAEQLPVTVRVTAEEPVLQGHVEFDGGGHVYPGSVIHGKVTMKNGTNAPKRVRLVLAGTEGAKATVSPGGAFDLGSGESAKDFTVAFGRDAALGGASLTLKVVDEADLSGVYANGLLTVTVKNPPTWLERNRWWIASAVILLVLLAAGLLLRRQAWKKKVAVRGLVASISRDGERVGPELKAPTRWAETFRFSIRDADGAGARLLHVQPGEPLYSAKRKEGKVLVRTPDGEFDIAFGGEGQPLSSGLQLAFRDERPRRVKRRKPRRKGDAKRPPNSEPKDDTEPRVDPKAPAPTPDYDDPWF